MCKAVLQNALLEDFCLMPSEIWYVSLLQLTGDISMYQPSAVWL